MTLSPLAFFDLLEKQAADWLPLGGAGWQFQRTIDFLNDRAVVRITPPPPLDATGRLLIIEARQTPGGGLQGSTKVTPEAPGQPWTLSLEPIGGLLERALGLGQDWQAAFFNE